MAGQHPKGKWLRRLGIVLLALLVVLVAFFGMLQTSWGKRQTAALLSSVLTDQLEWDVRIEGIRGFVPFDVRVGRITLSDAQGPWLEMKDASASWSFGALVKRRLLIRELGAGAIALHRLPAGEPEPETTQWRPPQLPALPSWLEVEEMGVARFSLGQAVLGTAADFSIHGHFRPKAPQLDLHIARTDAPTTRADLTAGLYEKALSLSLKAEDTAFLPRLLGVEEGLRLALEGAGPLANWEGAFNVELGGQQVLDGRYGIQLGDEVGFGGDLRLRPVAGFLPEPVAAVAPKELRAMFTAKYDSSGVLTVDSCHISAEEVDLEFAGQFHAATNRIEATSVLIVQDLALLAPITQMDLAGRVKVTSEFNGNADEARLALGVAANDVAISGARVSEAEIQVDATAAGWPDGLLRDVSVRSSGRFAGLSFKEIAKPEVRFALDAELATIDDVVVRKLEVTDGNITLAARGQVNPTVLSAALDTTVTVDELHEIARLLQLDFSGAAQFQTHLEVDGTAPSLNAQIDGRVTRPRGLPDPLPAVLGSDVVISAQVALEDSKAQIEGLEVQAGHAQLTASGTFDLTSGQLAAVSRLALPDLSVVAQGLGLELTGALEASVDVAGSVDSLSLQGWAKGTAVGLGGYVAEETRVSFALDGLPGAPQGHVDATITRNNQSLEAETDIMLEWPELNFPQFSVRIGENAIDGKGQLDLAAVRGEGELEARLENLASLGQLLNLPLSGSAHASARLDTGEGRRHLAGTLDARDIHAPFGSVQEAGLQLSILEPFSEPAGRADLVVTSLDAGVVQVASLELAAEGDWTEVRASLETNGTLENVTPFNASLTASLSAQNASLTVEQFKGKLEDFPCNIAEPFTITLADGGVASSPIRLDLAGGAVRIEGTYASDGIDVNGEWRDLPLALGRLAGAPALEGAASGSLAVSGSPATPRCEASLRLEDVRLALGSSRDLPALGASFETTLAGGRCATDVALEVPPAANAAASVSFPLHFSLSPWVLALPKDGALEARIDTEADLSAIPALLGTDQHMLAGSLAGRFEVGGTVREPTIHGQAGIEKGRYENTVVGAVLSDLDLLVSADNDVVELVRCHAGDGVEGEMTAEGRVSLRPDAGFPFDATATFAKARLVHRDDVSGHLDGRIDVSGSMQEAFVRGHVVVGPATIRIPKRTPPELTELEVTEIGGVPGEASAATPAQGGSAGATVHLDIECDIPGRVFVREAGLDSEWKGALKIQGTAQRPEVSGELGLVRGHVAFLGRRFDLKDSTITLDGSYPPSPYLNLMATARAGDLTAQLQIVGTASDLELKLTSDPPSSRDEILAKLLFDRSLARISPVQAIQLARAAALFTARPGGLGFLAVPSALPGVDRLDIRQSRDSPDETVVGVGKYLSDSVYVEVEQGTGKDSSAVSLEVELTPNLTIESEVGANSRSGVGLFWKKDY